MLKDSLKAALAAGAVLCAGCQAEGPDEASVDPRDPISDRGGMGVTNRGQEQGLGSVLPQTVDARKSVVLTETAILTNFTLSNVLNQLAAQNGGTGLNSTQLFRQLWDTQNPATGQADLQPSAHCNDSGNLLNGFPNGCRTSEGAQAVPTSITNINSYSAIGIYNRFDLAPTSGADCGEYRVVFGKTGGGGGRNFIIFEAALPNPRPDLGIDGCRPVQSFWRDLSTKTLAARATAVRDFYFTGLPGFSPVIHINNYGFNPAGIGQVRVNMFIGGPWMLKEFKIQRQCPAGVCTLKFAPVTVKANPAGRLFNPASAHALAPSFRAHFITQVEELAVNNVNTFNYSVPDNFNAAQSDAQSFSTEDDYSTQFGSGASTFRTDIQTELTRLGSPLTPNQIVARAQALSCGGCHDRSNSAPMGGGITFPNSASFVHSSESTQTGPEGTRFVVSNALANTFIPFRKQVMEDFLNADHPLTPVSRFDISGSATDGRFGYWVERRAAGVVMKASLDSGGESVLAFNRPDPIAVATDGVSVFWTEASGAILKVSVNGGAVSTLATGLTGLGGIATDGTSLFITQGGSILSLPVAGGATTALATGRVGLTGRLTVDGANLFWQEGNDVQRMPKGGGAVSLFTTRPGITGLASDGVRLWVAEDLNPGNVLAFPLAGGAPVATFAAAFNINSISAGGGHVVWTENRNPGVVMAKVK
ncbi:hypothetical protein D7Y13_13700 [Corallococcus praedator]|uniref:Cytochrome c domain-containing protein n=1 Tax=Corallococcus praedator TaxID=2316724 RepID=A0ABX9QLA3_9BACT|nr:MULTISPECIES: hypothetical protein [Corallococcus]RKH35551.1 hypothetical protein D7X75_03950 [Corallococcus sp. CA031C]RKI09841.1 hypothetical protein D7Y13_13700 [Corallococcus praedator]